MSTLHDRIEELADEWAGGTWTEHHAKRLRLILAETASEYDGAAHATAVGVEVARALAAAQPVEPEPDAAPQEDPCAGHYHDACSPPGSRPDCQPAQHVEPEPDQGGGDA